MIDSTHETVVVRQDDGVLTVTLDNPKRLNALSYSAMTAISRVMTLVDADDSVRVVVITGRGRAFCTGADLSSGRAIDGRPIGADEVMDTANEMIRAVQAVRTPVIAKINGVAAGIGVSLALAADLTYAAAGAYLLLGFINIGLMPDGGATRLVAAAVGRARANAIALLGERLPAVEAVEFGLLNAAVAEPELDETVAEVSERLARGPRRALQLTKESLNAAALPDLEEVFEREKRGQIELLASADFAEGSTAVLAKTPPRFA